jgi:hypothetical protein
MAHSIQEVAPSLISEPVTVTGHLASGSRDIDDVWIAGDRVIIYHGEGMTLRSTLSGQYALLKPLEVLVLKQGVKTRPYLVSDEYCILW